MATTHPKFVRWAVLIGIVIALNLFFLVARSLILAAPQYEDYCPVNVPPPATESACTAGGWNWVATPNDQSVTAVTKNNPEGYCDQYRACQPLYDAAQKSYALYAFALMVGLGILSLIVGVLPLGSSIVSSGFSYGGVLALIIAAGSYWNDAGDWLRLLVSVVALGALVYLGLKRFRD